MYSQLLTGVGNNCFWIAGLSIFAVFNSFAETGQNLKSATHNKSFDKLRTAT